jgi:hypothetical protein
VNINQQTNLKTVEIGLEAWLDHLHGKQEAMCSKPTTEKKQKTKSIIRSLPQKQTLRSTSKIVQPLCLMQPCHMTASGPS